MHLCGVARRACAESLNKSGPDSDDPGGTQCHRVVELLLYGMVYDWAKQLSRRPGYDPSLCITL